MYSTTQAYTPGQNLDTTRALLIGMKQKGTLQSYVAQHKNSPEYPYLLALASSINQISDAAKAADHQPAPQTVADQKLNALAPAPAPQLPENVGIGQLPAQNIANMAEGGIVAFGDGGEVPRYQDQGLVRVPGNMGGVSAVPYYFGGPRAEQQRLNALPGQYLEDALSAIGSGWEKFTAGTTIEAQRKAKEAQKKALEAEKAAKEAAAMANAPAPQSLSEGAVESALAKQKETPALDRSGLDKTGAEKPSADKAGLASLATPKISSKSAVKELEEAVYKNAPDKAAMMKEVADIDKPYLDKARANIEKESKRLESAKEQDFYMALIEGGLAAAGGESMYALQNIAKGGQKGVSSFGAALKEFRKATQENSRAEAELERYEATGKKEALKGYNEAQAKRDDRYAAGITALRAQEMQTQGTITAAGISAAASRDLANSYRAPAFAEQIRQHLAKELDSDPRYKYDATAKAIELQRRLEQELKKYPGMAQYAGAPGGGGAVDTTGFKVIGSRPSQ